MSGGAPGLLPQIHLRRTERELRLVVPSNATGRLGDVTARRLESAAEAFDLEPSIVTGFEARHLFGGARHSSGCVYVMLIWTARPPARSGFISRARPGRLAVRKTMTGHWSGAPPSDDILEMQSARSAG